MFVKSGDVRPLGLSKRGKNINVAFVSDKEDCGLIIYDYKTKSEIQRIPFPLECKVGNVYAVEIEGIGSKKFCYEFYENQDTVKDSYAKSYIGNEIYGERNKIFGVYPVPVFEWEGDVKPKVNYHESLVYLLHVRGFTKHASSKVKAKGTFKGILEKIEHLKALHVTTLELQPAYEFDETNGNYWGYSIGNYYTPKNSYAYSKDGVKEFKELIKSLHKEGIEVVMQFYFPQEIPEWDVLDILRFWISEYHITFIRTSS